MGADTDLELIKLSQSGDTSAFGRLICKYKVKVYRIAYKMLDGEDGVDDAVQEIFLKTYRGIKKFRFQSSFSSWLARIAVNHCINYLKSQKKIRLFQQNNVLLTEPYIKIEHNEEHEKVHQAINSLSPKQKSIIILHYFEGYNCEEIADIIGCSIGTVKSRLFYARMELKTQLESYLKKSDWIEGGENYEMYKM